jgi:hypothetical protein
MNRILWLLSIIFMTFYLTVNCNQQQEGQVVDLPTSLCLKTQHHGVTLPNIAIQIKYNIDTFPTYMHEATWFDTTIISDIHGRACLAPVPEGNHWIIAQGIDETAYPLEVFGNLPFTITIPARMILDTTLYVSEQH